MADSKARGPLSVNSPNKISKDMPGSDRSIPFSPRWLLPKPGDSKAGMPARGNHSSPYPGSNNCSDVGKSPGTGEKIHGSHKKKDVFRPTFLDMESGHRDCWCDEERDTNSSFRRDRWRVGDKELGDVRKMDRWDDTSTGKHFGEARRPPSECWTDIPREVGFDQRRESKWNTHWGPGNKEVNKWNDSGKCGVASHDKGLPHLVNHGKEERESDQYRPWRSVPSQGWGKVESPHNHFQGGSRDGQFGRGRGCSSDHPPPTFSLGHGRLGHGANTMNHASTHSQTRGFLSEKDNHSHGERLSSPFKYSKTKLLDKYRAIDTRLLHMLLNGFVQVPSLTQEELLEPLALSAPTPEELAILRGIEKGDIVSGAAPQISKEGSSGRGSSDNVQPRRMRFGSREDVSSLVDDPNDDAEGLKGTYSSFSVGSPHEKQVLTYGSSSKLAPTENQQNYGNDKHGSDALRGEGGSFRKIDDVQCNGDSNLKGDVSQPKTEWQSLVGEPNNAISFDEFNAPTDAHTRSSNLGWPRPQKNHPSEWERCLPNSSFPQNELNWQTGENIVLKRQASGIIDQEHESRKLLQLSPAPEDLILYYKDPQGAIQGPFSGSDIIGWFEAGYFGIDLQVRLANAPPDFPFSMLGDVMPHLKVKGPPPGFRAPKLYEGPDISSRPALGNQGKVLASLSEIDLIRRDEQRHPHSASTEAANRFLESLMVTNSSPLDRFPSSEGIQGYLGHNTSGLPPTGTEGSDSLDLLAKRLILDRQRSLPNAYSHWPGKDTSSIVSKSQKLQDPAVSQSKVPSSLPDLPPQPSHPQNIDMMSTLQGLPNRSSININNGVGGWSNFIVQGGLDPFKDKIDLCNGENLPFQAPFGLQQQRMATQNHPSVPNLLGQGMDNPSAILTAEKILSSALSQNPQALNLLQEQYLLQLQAQAPSLPQQLSIVNRILLLMEQQKQEKQLRKQQLLCQVLTEQNLRFGDSSYGQLQPAAPTAATISAGNADDDQFLHNLLHQMLQAGQVPVSSVQGDRVPNYGDNMLLHSAGNVGSTAGSDTSLHFPHQIFGTQQKSFSTLPGEDGDAQLKDAFLESRTAQSLATSAAVEKPVDDSCVLSTEHFSSNFSSDETASATTFHHLIGHSVPSEGSEVSQEKSSERASNNVTLVPEQATDGKGLPATLLEEPCVKEEQHCYKVSDKEEPKPVEAREVKRSSEKRLRKQKSSKAQPPSSDHSKGTAKLSNQFESGAASNSETKSKMPVASAEVLGGTSHNGRVDAEKVERSPIGSSKNDSESVVVKDEPMDGESVENQNASRGLAQQAWKATANVKPKSLLKIQQEEQRRRMQTEVAACAVSSSISVVSSSAPWAGSVSNSDPKISSVVLQVSSNNEANAGRSESSKSKKSQLHDLLAAEVLAKANEREVEASDTLFGQQSLPLSSSQPEVVDDDDFIEAKDTRKSQKKGGKVKGAGNKLSSTISLNDVVASSVSFEKVKNTRQMQPEKDLLPAPPQGPSLGDFVPWKGEPTSPSPSPAWSTDSGKLRKPTSLRDILKEQEKKGTSPSKVASPVQACVHVSSQSSSYKGEDELFWGLPDQSKPNSKQVDLPQLRNHGIWGTKSTLVKGASFGVALTRQKSTVGKPVKISSSSASTKSSLKGKRDGDTKHSEAMDFRDWCERESIRLTGSKDTSFLEFCLKQPRLEAEILLTQNLGSVDPNHEFIGKFLDYMEMLSSDVLEIAFQVRKDQNITSYGGQDVNPDVSIGNSDITAGVAAEAFTKGGKKRGKKGKKVSPSVLGFNVVSNRIMMGEIQTVGD